MIFISNFLSFLFMYLIFEFSFGLLLILCRSGDDLPLLIYVSWSVLSLVTFDL